MCFIKPMVKLFLVTGVGLPMTWYGLAAPTSPPVAPIENVTNTYFGTAVVDPYQYMEDLSDSNVVAWLKAQNDYTHSLLDRIPGRAALLARIQELDNAVTARVEDVRRMPDGRYFYLKRLPQDNTFKLYVRQGLAGTETLLFDPEKFAKAAGKPFAINYYRAIVGWGLCRLRTFRRRFGGRGDSLLETATGQEVDKPIDRAQFGGVSWRPDGKSFFYNRLQKMESGMPETERYQKSRVFLHVIGADADREPPAFGYEVSPRVKMDPADDPFVSIFPGSKYAVGSIEHGTQNEVTLYAAPLASRGQTQHAVAKNLRCRCRRHGFCREREGNFSADAQGRAAIQNHCDFPDQTRPGGGPDGCAHRQRRGHRDWRRPKTRCTCNCAMAALAASGACRSRERSSPSNCRSMGRCRWWRWIRGWPVPGWTWVRGPGLTRFTRTIRERKKSRTPACNRWASLMRRTTWNRSRSKPGVTTAK